MYEDGACPYCGCDPCACASDDWDKGNEEDWNAPPPPPPPEEPEK